MTNPPVKLDLKQIFEDVGTLRRTAVSIRIQAGVLESDDTETAVAKIAAYIKENDLL